MRLSAAQVEAFKNQSRHFFKARDEMRLLLRHEKHKGFTLVELITVLVVAGALAAVAIPRFFERTAFDDRAFRDQVVSTLRYAQKAAIAQRRFVCVTFTANSVSLASGTNSDCSAGAVALVSPSGTPYPLASTQSGFAPVPANFSFDCLGRPRDMALATGICGNNLAVLAANQTVQVRNVDPITIWRETGYVR